MSISVQEITKYYGTQAAVSRVSFSVSGGEIVGFIGPNGAGKSTTMKIITGTLPPDEGRVLVKDVPALENQKEIRRILGYLPENNPLYTEMYIKEYLMYVAGLQGMKGSHRKERLKEVIEMTGLGPESHKRIGSLSKGYRQRVGLAQALIHDPEILILDEPTSGLDPNQLMEIRTLISRIGREKTVLLSTHILQEVEAICDRVIIINKGSIVANEQASTLREQGKQHVQTIYMEIDSGANPALWESIPWVSCVKALDNTRILIESTETRDIRAELFEFAVKQKLTILSMSRKEKSLEEVFREFTS